MARKAEAPCLLPDLTSDVYSRWRASEIGSTTERLERQLMLERIGDVSGQRVLEIGCGDGELAVFLANKGAVVSAIDISEKMIAAARERASTEGTKVDFAVASAQEIPFTENAFDVVIAVTILCFVRDASLAFQEIARVLKPGGRLVIGELGAWSTWAMGRRLRAWLGSKLWRRGVFRTPAGFRKLAIASGLTPRAVRGAVYYPRVRWLMRLMAPHDRTFSGITSIGAAFLTFEAAKPQEKVQA
jgi:ubiquinone/menaquinone biosynthesis C-methylase UbiE